ncbi:hypothetical protein IV203_006809 [Nitzschia inconspicua]|uniref:Uncharacterized protein n=1 Tax=Nitzschia inconspicua TaxID=303405 RepID=A0A9K3P8C4_9STRA|nr:hypothetical protein IV203_006809 [Nitzschia inconspicua]
MAKNIAINNAPIVPMPIDPNRLRNSDNFFGSFAGHQKEAATTVKQVNSFNKSTSSDQFTPRDSQIMNDIANPAIIREAVEETMKLLEVPNSSDFPKFFGKEKSYPKHIGAAVNYLYHVLAHKKPLSTDVGLYTTSTAKEAYSKWLQFFRPGEAQFTFPQEVCDGTTRPSPIYHLLEGQSIIYLDWKLVSPVTTLYCPNCWRTKKVQVPLSHSRSNWAHSTTSLFPVWTARGTPIWCILMNYECKAKGECCKSRFAANDGRLLTSLPAHVRQAYPVDPRYATGGFHLAECITSDLDILMKTYASGSFISRKMYRRLCNAYVSKVQTYLSKNPSAEIPLFDDFTNGFYPPSPASIRKIFESAEESAETPYGYSFKDRYTRELQSVDVEPDDAVAFDWTFQLIKNYILPGAKAAFTGIKGKTNEIISLVIVPSTKTADVSHALIQSRQKHTLDQKCKLYWQCLVDLQRCLYGYLPGPLSRLISSLKDGTFDSNGRNYSSEEIDQLRHSKKWKQRFSSFLPKTIHTASVAETELVRWIAAYQGRQDDEGRFIFSGKTVTTTKNQFPKLQYVTDPENIEMNLEIPAPSNSPHGIPKWISRRPESHLEKFHEFLAHVANSGTGRNLADILTLGGVSEFNVAARHKSRILQRKIEGQERTIPTHFEDIPPYFDHSLLIEINRQAAALKLKRPFENTTECKPNNGELFLSSYFEEQQARNISRLSDKDTGICRCDSCKTFRPETIVGSVESATFLHERGRAPPMTTKDEISCPPIPQPVPNSLQLCVPPRTPPMAAEDKIYCPPIPQPVPNSIQLCVPPRAPPMVTEDRISCPPIPQPVPNSLQPCFPPISMAPPPNIGVGYIPNWTNCFWPNTLGYACAPSQQQPQSTCCVEFADYCQKKRFGQNPIGRPPHGKSCPKKIIRLNGAYW